MELADVLKALADPNRLRILCLLNGQTLCVCDLEEVLGLNQSNLSRHLARLRTAGLVTMKKRTVFRYYSRRPMTGPYGTVLEALLDQASQDPERAEDRNRLRAKLAQPDPACPPSLA